MSNYAFADRDQNSVLFEDPTNSSSTFRHKRNLGRKDVDSVRLHNIRSEYIIQRTKTPNGITDVTVREPLSVRLITTGSDANQSEIDKMISTLIAAVLATRQERAAGRLIPSDTAIVIDPIVST